MKRKQGGEGSPSPFEDLAVHLDRAVDVQHDVQPDRQRRVSALEARGPDLDYDGRDYAVVSATCTEGEPAMPARSSEW